MKVLFVCWQNIGRSQMAKALYNQLTKSNDSDSAGTQVDIPGETLQERREQGKSASHTIDIMQKEGIDVSGSKRKQLTKAMLGNYDLVINMAQPEYTPSWLSEAPNYINWDVEDPGGKGYESTLEAEKDIKTRVLHLIDQR
jgi:arsenate reductase